VKQTSRFIPVDNHLEEDEKNRYWGDDILLPEAWKLLIVDDEEDVHKMTRLALSDYTFQGRGLEFLSAGSGMEARDLILKHPDISLILLDVVMETDDAGLRLVRFIREELENHLVQIILRTGQPGLTPQREAVSKYNINGYASKIELTAEKMFSTVTASFRAYQLAYSLNRLNRDLKKELEERRRAEDEVRRLTRFQEIVIDNADIWLDVKDDQAKTVIWNKAAEKISGYYREEVLGHDRKAEWLYPDQSYRKKVKRKTKRRIEKSVTEERFETKIRCRDGQSRIISWNLHDLEDWNGQKIGEISLGRDVTRQRQLEDQIRQSKKMEAVGRMAGGVAHDFNNLLTVIRGYCDIAAVRLDPKERLYDNIRKIDKAAERAESLTRQLLSFSRHRNLALQAINLNSVIRDNQRMLVRIIGSDIELITRCRDKIKNIEGDYGQIEQIVMNLVLNARDAMPDGGVLTVETRNITLKKRNPTRNMGMKAGDYVILEVADTGIGMDKKTKEQIFEPFFTTKKEGKGTGLGLSTVYAITTQIGGYILVDSEPGIGTSFKIYFSCSVDTTAVDNVIRKIPEQLAGNETILVVEDHSDVLKLTSEALNIYGYKVFEASNAVSAMLICEEQRFSVDLLLTDLMMPHMNGIQLVRRLREKMPDLKALFMSGYPSGVIAEKGKLKPGENFIRKPFTAIRLLRMLRRTLDSS